MKTINESQNEKIDGENSMDKYEDKTTQNKIIIKDSKYFKRKFKKIIKRLFILTIFGLCYFLYFLSLESCFDGEGLCSTYFKWIKKKVVQEIISSILLAIMIQLILFKKISNYHLIHIIIVFFFFIIIDMEWISWIMDILISFFILY